MTMTPCRSLQITCTDPYNPFGTDRIGTAMVFSFGSDSDEEEDGKKSGGLFDGITDSLKNPFSNDKKDAAESDSEEASTPWYAKVAEVTGVSKLAQLSKEVAGLGSDDDEEKKEVSFEKGKRDRHLIHIVPGPHRFLPKFAG